MNFEMMPGFKVVVFMLVDALLTDVLLCTYCDLIGTDCILSSARSVPCH